jgi:DNA-binding transcriptional MocR family regulator
MGLSLNMARGKPCSEQVDLSDGLIDSSINFNIKSDYRNYGIIDGIDEAKEIYKDLLNVANDELILGGNSSLTLMYDTIAKAMLLGTIDSKQPWSKLEKVKFLCPVPGYDRHFAICEALGIEMINIPTDENGPIMDLVMDLVAKDESIKGIWCVPKYTNPTGVTYSDEVVTQLAEMKTAADDFRIFWDNAYIVHHLTESPDELKDILQACKVAKNSNRVYIFSSTSKITFPGAGVAMMAMSKENADFLREQISFQTIGPNKINQYMHAKFLPSAAAIDEHMKKHAMIISPKFDKVDEILTRELKGKNIASWVKPRGGYFISLEVLEGCAKEVVALCKDTGVILTGAGATFPYGKDPKDSNIRIAPTFPPMDELEKAIDILCICVQVAALNKLMA